MSSAELTINGLQTIEANDIECDYLTVYEDLTVYGNQIFIGNQIVSGNLSVSGVLNGVTANFTTLNNTGTITTSGLVVSNNTRIRGNLSVSGTLSVSNNVQVGGTGFFSNISVTGKIDMSDTTNSKKIVMFDSFNDTHQYYGFGVNPFVSRYQVANTGANHIFYGGFSGGSVTYATIGFTQSSFVGNLTTSGLNVSNNVSIMSNLSVSGAITTSGITVSNNVSCNFLQTNSINSNYIFNSGLMEAGNITVDTQWVKNELNFVDNLLLDPPLGTIRYDANQLQYNLTDPTQLQDLSHRFRINSNEQFIISSGNAEFKGSVDIATTASAQYFSGNGGGLTGIDVLSISGVLPVNRGGTNTSILTANKIMVGNGSGAVLTPAGLHWDNANSRLGLLTATPNSTVDIAGTLQVSGVVAFANNLTVSGNATFGSTLSASGLFVSNNSIMSGSLIVSNNSTFGQNMSISGLIVSNNSLVRGTLLVSGNATFGSSLSTSGLFVSNNTLMNGTLIVGGNATFGNNVSTSSLRVSNNASITGTLIVQGNATFGNNVSTSSLRVSNNASITGTLMVQGNATFFQGLSISGLNVSSLTRLNTVTVSGVATFNDFIKVICTALPDYIGTNRGRIAIDNKLSGGEAMISLKNLTTTTNQYDVGVNQVGYFTIEKHTPLDGIATLLQIYSDDLLTASTLDYYGAINAVPVQGVQTCLKAFSTYDGTNTIVADFKNAFEQRDAFIRIRNVNSTNTVFQNSMKIGVDATGDLCIEDEANVKHLQINTSGYTILGDGLSIAANSTAFPGSSGGIGKGIFMKYSTAGGQDQAYIQSINRSNSQLFPLVIQSNQMWLNGDRKASAVIPAGVNIVGAGNGFGSTGSTLHHYISSDNYPLISHLAFTHSNEGIAFGMYYDGTNWRASDAGSQYSIYKLGTELLFNYDDVATQGATCNGTDAAFKIQLNGGTVFNYAQTNNVKVNSPFFVANFSGLTGIAGFPSRIISSAALASEWIAAFNQSDAGTGSRGVIFTRSGTILGSVRYDAAGVAYLTTSDRRTKKNIRSYGCGLSIIRRLKPSKYEWIVDGSSGEGFIADELQEVIPDAVFGDKDAMNEDGSIDPQSIDQTKIIPSMVRAIQQLDSKVENLNSINVDTLLEKIASLETKLNTLEEKLKKSFVI